MRTRASASGISSITDTSKPSGSVTASNAPDKGGWDPSTGAYNTDIKAQIEQAFANVDLNLRDAGGKGWQQVFRVNSYHVPLNDEALGAMAKGFKKWMPDHAPIWTCVGVQRLGEDDMRVEIEVVAHDPK
ncbi:L-PSP endoribonuclease family protein [Paraphaeosphaeria minitans]|uniref:L-PSP endoribonuclease family protein n=1 Tax=Paraphaeosphaeria minitans TaxID=565426 RepID=A0A9P6KNL4_9PLEO|nr:L-PSP endoribonuclease family protein [Paraphaeosphaeria minitans]